MNVYNILFLTMSKMKDINQRGIYTDLIRKFQSEGHQVYVVSPSERRDGMKTRIIESGGAKILSVRTLNVQKTNVIEKGIGQLTMEWLYKRAIMKYLSFVKFDLILYSTPPITFTSIIEWAKHKNPQAKTYLMLKDIFPQNAVDLGMLTKTGMKGLLYKYFRNKEKKLYVLSDYIGCMSPANVKYIISHNPDVDVYKVEICPNSNEPIDNQEYADREVNVEDVNKMVRESLHLPIKKTIFIYGGNMGKPQGIPFLLECMNAVKDREDCYFVIVGDGTEYPKLKAWADEVKPKAVSLFQKLPKADYDKLANACDVGMIFLDYNFTIPNCPSRLLPYLMGKKPIIVATDPNCDTGAIAEINGYGFYCPSNSVDMFVQVINKMLVSNIKQMGENGYKFYLNNYTVQHTYNSIMKHF